MRLYKFSCIFLAISLFLLSGCAGGGTVGTGGAAFEGTITSAKNGPLPNISVTIAETGETATTDESGQFSIETSSISGDVELLVEGETEQGSISETVVVEDVPAEPATISVELEVNENSNLIVVEGVEVRAKIVGTCDFFFENRRVIRQTNAAPQGVECTAKIWLSQNSVPLPGLGFAIQVRSCSEDASWITLGKGTTRTSGDSIGIGQIDFNFIDDSEHCVYRIIAPLDEPLFPEVIHEIHTFTKQSQDAGTVK
ncbi:MAG: carboxypeptidase regulatory-like domain-containing protein [Deltaproteobacteria bacterium]|nr:carboxypeptidase regulatory-like domain-containing protein [Deltaproteobacteria bacterium]